ncbi:hypothetical protein EKO27_g8641 [Xylaria grammica]|uniref:Transcription factor domain-containing protein n=1 Tax=Xylaria grammica TaxID=363999 RepID=A0A439CWD6_9PEZI|nr:hypothetical protein EKO27_g8641 [Xylaria grammica]
MSKDHDADNAEGVTPYTPGQKVIQFKNQSVDDIAWANAYEPPSGKQIAPRQKQPSQRSRPYAIKQLKRAQAQLAGTASIPRTLNAEVWAVECITGRFLETCLPPSESQEAPLAWLGEIKKREQYIDALPLAMSALALGWAGHIDNEPQLVNKGIQLYNAAIRQLRDDYNTYSPLQSLVVTTVFVAFELCQFGSKDRARTQPSTSVCAGSHMWKYGPFRNHKKNAYHQFYDLSAEACELLGHADDLEQLGNAEAPQPAQVLHDMLDLISRLKTWMQDSNLVGFSGPFKFPDNDLVARHRLDRATARGYPTKLPLDSAWTSDTLYGERLLHNYWTVRLDLYMTILDNSVLRSLLENSGDFRMMLIAELETKDPEAEQSLTALIFEECRKLANHIAVYGTSGACHSISQSFGSLVTVYTLETAIRWYERHNMGAGQMDVELEQHCRAILAGIKIEESKDPCAFEVSVLPDEVLRRQWC